jgi:hypothetical protein
MQEEISDANRMKVGTNLMGAGQGGSEKIDAFHGLPPRDLMRQPMN